MPSPFPGTDPYLELLWVSPDLHDALIVFMREALIGAMPPGYAARSRTLVYTESGQRRGPDVPLVRRPKTRRPKGGGLATLPGLRPVGGSHLAAVEEVEHESLEVIRTPDGRVVTSVEILSPANKRPGDAGRVAFQAKQAELRRAGVKLVEIDLLRGGAHISAVPRASLEALGAPFDYHVAVTVAGDPDEFYAACWALADRLPVFGLPLDPGVPPPTLDLKPMVDRAYDSGRYAGSIDYAAPCDPLLTGEQAAWTGAILAPAPAPRSS